jgi:hypothetical protein
MKRFAGVSAEHSILLYTGETGDGSRLGSTSKFECELSGSESESESGCESGRSSFCFSPEGPRESSGLCLPR